MLNSFFTFLIGICIGSFLNAAIFRVHEGESVLRGRSKCRSCEQPLGPRDLVPVLSFLLLRGRCRRCKSVLSWQYPLVELATGLLFFAFFLKHQEFSLLLLRDWVFVSFLIIIFVYDFRHMLILDRFTIPAMIVAVFMNLLLENQEASSMILGAVVIGGFFYGQFVISKGTWVGGGDIRMGALMGFMLGFSQGLVALFFAYLIGAIISVILILLKKAQRKTPIPFGTFLTASILILLFVGNAPLRWYLSLFV